LTSYIVNEDLLFDHFTLGALAFKFGYSQIDSD